MAQDRAIFKGKGKGLDTCYSATYMSGLDHDQQRFIISEVAEDWHEPMTAMADQ